MVTMMEASGELAKVERAKLAACMTCPLCHMLFIDATTVSECLHTFCRKCIYEKIRDEDLNSCPVCNIHLGCAPIEKLRVDNSLQDLRFKIFPSKRLKSNTQEYVPVITLPSRRKERSLSSLVVSTARVSTNSCQEGNRKPTTWRRNTANEESKFPTEDPLEKVEDFPHDISLLDRPSNITYNGEQSIISFQNPPAAESSRRQIPNRSAGNNVEALEEKANLAKHFNHLIQYVSKTKSNKFNSHEVTDDSTALDAYDNKVNIHELKECANRARIPGNEYEDTQTPSTSATARPRWSQGIRQKRPVDSAGLNVPAQAVVNANRRCDGRPCPIWFSLVASEDQGDAPLPQITSSYLRIKDGNLPVSYIKRYLVQRLGLSSENEVEISLRGQPVCSTLQLQNLVDWWVQTSPASEAIETSVGNSGQDFVMVLSYARKVHLPQGPSLNVF